MLFFGAHNECDNWRSRLPHQESRLPETLLKVPAPGYRTFGALDCLLDAVLPIARREAPELVRDYEGVLSLFTDRADENALGRLVPLAESAALGTTRRISRESHESAKIIDEVARFLALLPVHTSTYASGALLVAPGLEYWDRPSLRVLYRAALLADEDAPLTVIGLCGPSLLPKGSSSADSVQQRMGALRSRFFGNLAERDGVFPVYSESATPTLAEFPCEPIGMDPSEDGEELLRSIGEALSFQNFERVLLLAESITRSASGELAVHIQRLSAISEAQSGELDSARERLSDALNSADNPVVYAHLRYLLGLISTKRFYSLEEARQHYATGKEAVQDLVEIDPEARVEYAWLLNGEALVSVMQARTAKDQEIRTALHEDAFSKAFDAFRLVQNDRGISAFYLRHNLAANITFLLEITSRVPEARKFWQRVMEAPSRAESKEFILPYRLRTGLLLHKEGDNTEAMRALEDSLDAARELGDGFYEERVLASLGYVAATTGRMERACAAFTDGMALATRLRDPQAQQVHASGLLWLAARGASIPGGAWLQHVHAWPQDVRERLANALAEGTLGQTLADLGLQLQVPGPKLPPHIPFVDLEDAPKQDLNRLLVGADGQGAPTSQQQPKERVGV
ncbi:hypothetical protein ACH4GP_30690 [Streptomyces celluloflavus]|uniref:Tetratricopeptide repeat protein n=1 Tax=Streptomyces celluloflavus TaxID=58344 RepID=A0ABW7RKU2_9ACTN